MLEPCSLSLSTSLTNAYIQRGEEQIFLNTREQSGIERDVDKIVKSLAFQKFFESLGKPLADVQVRVLGKDVVFSHEDKILRLKTSEEISSIETKSPDADKLKSSYIKEAKTIENAAGKINIKALEVLQRFDEEDHEVSPGLLVNIGMKPATVTKAPVYVPPETSPRKTSRKLKILQKKLKEAQKQRAPYLKAFTQPYNVRIQTSTAFKDSYFNALSLEEKKAFLQEVLSEVELEALGQEIWQNTSTLSSDFLRYKGWDKKALALEKLIENPELFKKVFKNKKQTFKKVAETIIHKQRVADELPFKTAEENLRALISEEKKYLRAESEVLNQIRSARQDETSSLSNNEIILRLSSKTPMTIPGLKNLLENYPADGDPRVLVLKANSEDTIYYDDLLYLLRHELSRITQEDGSIDRSQALLLKPENNLFKYLLPIDSEAPLQELAEDKAAINNIQLAYRLALEYIGLDFLPEHIGKKASEVVPLIDKTVMPHFAVSEDEHDIIYRLLAFPKLLQKATKDTHEGLPFFEIPKYLFLTLCKLKDEHPSVATLFSKETALGSSSSPGPWKKALGL